MSMAAVVKSVLSGDTLVLIPKGTAPGDTSKERQLSLAFVTAPRLKREGDEPFAFNSREFLRRNLVGREIQFKVLYTVPTGNREYGIAVVPNGPSIVEYAVAEGWVKVRDDAGKREEQSEHADLVEKLKALESKARLEYKGQWSQTDNGHIAINNEAPPVPNAFLQKWKGQQIEAVVERVIAGDRIAVRLLLALKEHQQIVVLVAGIKAPQSSRPDAPAEEYGDEAKNFVEARLLQRTVKVELVGLSPQNQFIGHVIHPKGSIAEFILVDGLARCFDQHSSMLGAGMANLRAQEARAKEKRINMWKGFVVKAKTGAGFDCVVSRVQSADTIWVRNKAGAERKLSLSSVKAPPRPAGHTDPKVPSQWQAEAKEFLRKKLIGKHVQVTIDGKRPGTEGYEEREMATVLLAGQNIALSLIENGLATVIRHRRDDEDRSPIWDTLLAAEETAIKEEKGLHNPKAPAPKPIVDASESEQKAKAHLSFLSRQRRIPAIVDFIASGSRFKLLIPKENVRLTFVLSGIRAPRTARNASEKSEPFGPEALEFTSKRAYQRDVEIDVEAIDKVNGFIGTMYVNRENLAKLLVEEGLASVHAYSAEQSGHGTELFAAEKAAKEARKNLWQNWTPQDDADDSAEPSGSTEDTTTTFNKRQDYRDVVVTNVDESGKMKVQLVGSGTDQLEKLMASFRNFHLNKSNATPLSGPPKVGDIVAAKFSEDGEFYRAKVRRVDREAKKADVLYIDYGNSETVPFTSLRPLTQAEFSTTKLRAQAVDAVLSFCQFPGSEMYANDAKHYLLEITGNQQLVGNVDFIEKDGTMSLTLFKDGSKSVDDNINSAMIEEGMCMVPKKLKAWEKAYADRFDNLRKKEQEAKEGRRGIWEYGDLTED
ncbi:hypothetical protein TWF569_008243 [Orbilia oligospora]|uniref:Probable endonuclease LCL3 n=1 Tax=Orbilia oligospora TaxID=2813651 RepID=A0A7C8JEQ7_ORBOL|nr:hypothetical protein TWF706_001941 [Orbilia oligospora]KAF3118979.1 hypothetical protein TWF703_003836 [Orbilia oligospora]KAF3140488.1 hypothetical protein TWF569_008243 [Orbilia oligospora]